MMKSTDPDDVPAFVAKDLHKLPPVTFDHVDVTRLLMDITSLKTSLAEVQSKLEVSNTTIGSLRAEVELLRKAVSESRAPNKTSLNIRCGAQNASIGSLESVSRRASPAAENACVASCPAAAVAVSSPVEVVTRVCTSTPNRAPKDCRLSIGRRLGRLPNQYGEVCICAHYSDSVSADTKILMGFPIPFKLFCRPTIGRLLISTTLFHACTWRRLFDRPTQFALSSAHRFSCSQY
ncbi:hypothetical protein PYW07_005435 [Mythimna separata]|uniref:Uncharacterized protein n=1 Tax=Mythimna separata TaxID=271217 RepID=A0AAD7YFT5_MYTSE|nr:hypothetical protein PYW07_005435 [Mythimna separata]